MAKAAAESRAQSADLPSIGHRRRHRSIIVWVMALACCCLSFVSNCNAIKQFDVLLPPDLEPQRAAYGLGGEFPLAHAAHGRGASGAGDLVQYDLFQQQQQLEQVNNAAERHEMSQRQQQAAAVASSQWPFADADQSAAAEQRHSSRSARKLDAIGLDFGSGQSEPAAAASSPNGLGNNNNNADEPASGHSQQQADAASFVELGPFRTHHNRDRIAPRSVLLAQQQQQDEQEQFGGDSEGDDEPPRQQPAKSHGHHQQQEQQQQALAASMAASDYLEGQQQQQQQQRHQRAMAIEGDNTKQRDDVGGGDGSMSNEPQANGGSPTSTATSGGDHQQQQQKQSDEQPQLKGAANNSNNNNETTSAAEPAMEVNHGQDEGKQSGSLDAYLARFIKAHLIPNQLPESEHKRTDKLASEFGKLYRVLRVTSKWARSLRHNEQQAPGEAAGATSEGQQQQQQQAPPSARSFSSSQEPTARGEATNMERGRAATPGPSAEPRSIGGGGETGSSDANEGALKSLGVMRRRSGGNLLVGRLAKKTDWNALFVKLAKVFLQYFLDLMLNDMFGTTGSNTRSFVSTEIDMRKSLKNFLRFASGLQEM